MSTDDFRMPQELNLAGLSAAEEIVSLCKMLFGPEASGGGCRAFYTPEEWKARGEEYGCDSVLIVCHDGGSLAPMFNGDYEDDLAYQTLRRGLEAKGFYVDSCTSWYSAVYKNRMLVGLAGPPVANGETGGMTMPRVCPRCRENDLRVHARVVIKWDGVLDEIPDDDLVMHVASDGFVDDDSRVLCTNPGCGWTGIVRELTPLKE